MDQSQDNKDKAPLDTAEFVQLLTVNQRKIYSYILKMVVNYNDADDIMQETTAVMWKKIGSFERGSNFLGWAIRIAHYNILAFRKSNRCLILDDELLDQLHVQVEESSGQHEQNLLWLRECLAGIKHADLELVKERYMKGLTVKEMAKLSSKAPQSLYRSLGRIHDLW
ncbi:MAG: sigma-70 family RNA polymerase sigma factor [Sedimentisphaerales bacterium]|nr:sigma-70 family RNA polymerase sigma factor [Sedimentisphaerales bacterium]